METIEFLQQPISDSVLLQILMYQQALSPTWGYSQGSNQLVFLHTHTKKGAFEEQATILLNLAEE